ncbi:FecCD family ABC transporter permease [Paenibacillus xerothermodurans]|uniref:Iron ABC transporter permease n=1 Tax=Paenibacillus xerothermodurans TaxID=1977292 RepID=A0A2W1NCR3_PAEXE|nr:iron ABC transporter permease [Paenibacillus xerothermodurans]PZE22287.1 iron ABC transporter permease [Paenibacillus xerothermodurans]
MAFFCKSAVWCAGVMLILLGIFLSISFGAVDISPGTVREAVLQYDPGQNMHTVIREIRLPRAVAGAIVGAAFAVAGAIMQGLTRNPLADSGLLGLNAGAGLVLALCFALVPNLPYSSLMVFCFLGAAVGAALVFGVSSFARGGLTPLRLTLAGAAVSSLLIALSEGIAILFRIGQDLAFWYAGGLGGTQWLQIKWSFPWIAGAVFAAILLSRSITLLSMGDEVARGLGQHIFIVKVACMIIVVILAACAVSLAGPVAFVGLVVPHIARMVVGLDYRWIIPYSALFGSILMIYADLAARMVRPPYETPVGALIALIGVPVFLFLSRKEKRVL